MTPVAHRVGERGRKPLRGWHALREGEVDGQQAELGRGQHAWDSEHAGGCPLVNIK